jgi:hypothetical protein
MTRLGDIGMNETTFFEERGAAVAHRRLSRSLAAGNHGHQTRLRAWRDRLSALRDAAVVDAGTGFFVCGGAPPSG